MTDDRMPDRTDSAIRALVIELVDATPPPPSWESIRARLDEGHEGGDVTTTTPTRAATGAVDDDALPTYVQHDERRTPRWRPIAAATGAVGVLVGGSFALAAFNVDDGAASPEAAAEEFVEAITAEDVLGALESLPPSEREVLTDAALDLSEEAQRLGLTSGLDARDVSGFDFEVTGLTTEVEDLGEGVAAVHLGGTLVSRATGTELPLSDAVFEAITDDDSLPALESGVADLSRLFAEEDVFVVAIEEDGGWHTSAWYTIAEYLRRGTDQPLPAFGAPPTVPSGADSPEQAVERYFEASLQLDLPGALGLMEPGESRVLYDYGPLFFDDAERALAEQPRTATLDDLQIEVSGDGDTRSVRVTGAAYTIEEPGGRRSSVRFDGECATYSGIEPGDGGAPDTDEDQVCRTDPDASIEPWEWEVAYGATYVTVERDGRWFLSPARSAAATLVDGARLVPDDALTGEQLDRGAPFGLFWRVTNVLGGGGPFGGYGVFSFGMVAAEEVEMCTMETHADGTESVEVCEFGVATTAVAATEVEAMDVPIEPQTPTTLEP